MQIDFTLADYPIMRDLNKMIDVVEITINSLSIIFFNRLDYVGIIWEIPETHITRDQNGLIPKYARIKYQPNERIGEIECLEEIPEI